MFSQNYQLNNYLNSSATFHPTDLTPRDKQWYRPGHGRPGECLRGRKGAHPLGGEIFIREGALRFFM